MLPDQSIVLTADADYVDRRSRRGAAIVVGSSVLMTCLALLLQPDHLDRNLWILVLVALAAYSLVAPRLFRKVLARMLQNTRLVVVTTDELVVHFGARPAFRAQLEDGLSLRVDRDASAWVVESRTPRTKPCRVAVAAFPRLDRFLEEHLGKLTDGGSPSEQA